MLRFSGILDYWYWIFIIFSYIFLFVTCYWHFKFIKTVPSNKTYKLEKFRVRGVISFSLAILFLFCFFVAFLYHH